MKNKNAANENVKTESVEEFLKRGGEIKVVRDSNRNRSRENAKPKLHNYRKHGPRPKFLQNQIY